MLLNKKDILMFVQVEKRYPFKKTIQPFVIKTIPTIIPPRRDFNVNHKPKV